MLNKQLNKQVNATVETALQLLNFVLVLKINRSVLYAGLSPAFVCLPKKAAQKSGKNTQPALYGFSDDRFCTDMVATQLPASFKM